MSLQKYDVVEIMVPFSKDEDKKNGHKTLNSDRMAEAQLSGQYKYRPCIVVGSNKKSGDIILAEVRTNRDKKYRSMLNDPDQAGIKHKSSILTKDDQLVHVKSDVSNSLESLKCGHLSKKDISRFEQSYLEINHGQKAQPTNQRQYETLEERERRIERELDEQLAGIEATPKSGPSDRQLLSKMKDMELDYSSNVKEKSREYGD